MTIQAYLQNKLEQSGRGKERTLTKDLPEAIFKLLMRKRRGFRKWSIDEDSQANILRVIKEKIDSDQPIHFTFPFGGYKLFRLPTAPNPDWAEFFTLAYIQEYLSPIAAIYKPGIKVSFWSDDKIAERMNNVPAEDTDSYNKLFRELLEQFNKYSYENFSMELFRAGDIYEKNEYEQEILQSLIKATRDFQHKDKEYLKRATKMAELNVQWDGVMDMTKLTLTEKKAYLQNTAVIHNAETGLQKRVSFVKGPDKIILFTTPLKNGIGLGTTKYSMTKFWTGAGLIEKAGDKLKDLVLPPSKIEIFNNAKAQKVEIDIKGANFKEIRVV